MTDCVRETLCTHCIHREVCSIKTSYLDTLVKLPYVRPDFALTLTCRHYSKKVSTPRTSLLDTLITTSNANEIKGVYTEEIAQDYRNQGDLKIEHR